MIDGDEGTTDQQEVWPGDRSQAVKLLQLANAILESMRTKSKTIAMPKEEAGTKRLNMQTKMRSWWCTRNDAMQTQI